MLERLKYFMAEMESWESAAEFGIPQELWAAYQVRSRIEDLYITSLSAVFDILRQDEIDASLLDELAKTLLVYSRSSTAQFISGIERNTNLLISAAVFYIAEFPATAAFVAEQIDTIEDFSLIERFLYHFLIRKHIGESELDRHFNNYLSVPDKPQFDVMSDTVAKELEIGLKNDPRRFIAAKLTLCCLSRFSNFNIWKFIRDNAANYDPEVWRPFFMAAGGLPIWELFPSQATAIKTGILADVDGTFSLQMPTSSGKTSLCEIFIYNEVKARGNKVLFLVPFRALAAEIRNGISKRLGKAGVSVVASHGGNIPTRSEGVSAENADVLIITPEKFASLSQHIPELESSFNTIICDEGHLIDDGSRGLSYELLLTKLKNTQNVKRKIIFISAILPNVDLIHEWLDGEPDKLATSDYKPVETDYAIITPAVDKTWRLEFNTIYNRPKKYELHKFLIQDDFRFVNPETGNRKLIQNYKSYTSLAAAAALKARRTGPVAIFTTQRSHVTDLANKLIEMFQKKITVSQDAPTLSNKLPDLIEYSEINFGRNYRLSVLLHYGIGFHHGHLPQEIRREMEGAIQTGLINILICTSTLAEGVNLPIRSMVVHTIKRFSGRVQSPIKQRSIKNIIGRAGRAGKETRGRIIFANKTERVEIENVFKDNLMEPAYGTLYRLVKAINDAVSNSKLALNNELFEKQESSFLDLLDKIDMAMLDLIPPAHLEADVFGAIENSIEQTLAFQLFETNDLKERIKEIFRLRLRFLEETTPRDSWALLKSSGSSPRYWRFINEKDMFDDDIWLTLAEIENAHWLDQVVLPFITFPTTTLGGKKKTLKIVIREWMRGKTYHEISASAEITIDECLSLLNHDIGYVFQDHLGKITQIMISKHGEENISELARDWVSLMQYGLGNLQQLDLFELGASDRLAVWGIQRFLDKRNIHTRKKDLLTFLRFNSSDLVANLNNDRKVPQLSIDRIVRELRLS